jgi:hypothetical protein
MTDERKVVDDELELLMTHLSRGREETGEQLAAEAKHSSVLRRCAH